MQMNEDFERESWIDRTIDLERWEKLITKLSSSITPKDPERMIDDDHCSPSADPGTIDTQKIREKDDRGRLLMQRTMHMCDRRKNNHLWRASKGTLKWAPNSCSGWNQDGHYFYNHLISNVIMTVCSVRWKWEQGVVIMSLWWTHIQIPRPSNHRIQLHHHVSFPGLRARLYEKASPNGII